MTKPVLLGKSAALTPQMPAGRTSKTSFTMGGSVLGPSHAFTIEVNETSGLNPLGIVRLWKVLTSAPWVSETSSATVYPHGENPLGGSATVAFMHTVAVDDTRAVMLWRLGAANNNGTTTWRYYAAVVSRTGDTVSVGTQVEVLTPLVNNPVGASWVGYSLDRWDGTTEGANHWQPSHSLNGLLELTSDGFVAWTTLTYTNPSTFERTRSVLVARRFQLSGSTITAVTGDAGKWIHIWDTTNSSSQLYARDIARLSTGQYVAAVGNSTEVDIYLVVVAADLPPLQANSILLTGATAGGGRDRMTRIARAPDGTVSVVTSREDLAPKELRYHSLTVAANGSSSRVSLTHATNLYSWGYWESPDALNDSVATGQLPVWSVESGLRLAVVGLARQGGLEEADPVPTDLHDHNHRNSHMIVMPDRKRVVMRLTTFDGTLHQYFLYIMRTGTLAPRDSRIFFDRV